MQPTNFPALVNNFSNEKQNKNRKKIIKKRTRIVPFKDPACWLFFIFSTETTKPVKKTHIGRAATGTNPIKREKIFNFFFFLFSCHHWAPYSFRKTNSPKLKIFSILHSDMTRIYPSEKRKKSSIPKSFLFFTFSKNFTSERCSRVVPKNRTQQRFGKKRRLSAKRHNTLVSLTKNLHAQTVARRLLTNQLKLKVDLESDRHKSCVHKQNKKGISLLAAKRQLEREKNEQLKGKKNKMEGVCIGRWMWNWCRPG